VFFIKERLNVSKKEKKKPHRCEVYSRPVGYLSPTSKWNAGKQEEFEDRKEYKVK
jgi:anaerobic ribonucleoside-triphosphate reductase